jgi:hypothetical protein
VNTPLLITEEIVNPEYRQTIQEKYFACGSNGYLIDEDAIDGELVPALSALVERTDNPEVVSIAIGLAGLAGWNMGYLQNPEVADETLGLALTALKMSPNNSPARIVARLIQLGQVNPVEVRRGMFPDGFPANK